jgi:membrane-associated phospholipid phosphatase
LVHCTGFSLFERRRKWHVFFGVSWVALVPTRVDACEPEGAKQIGYGLNAAPWHRLPCNALEAFSGENLALHFAAILGSVQLSQSGEDHQARLFFERRLGFRPFSDAMVLLGYAGPPIVAAGLYLSGLIAGQSKLTAAGAAAVQALGLTLLATTSLKLLTGRPYPSHGIDREAPERFEHPEWAREWNGPTFGIPAWPSGHTAVAVSIGSAMTAYYIDVRWVPWLAYPVSGAIALGMLTGAHHWLSDVFAGAILGHTIGWSVGSNFKNMQSARDGSRRTLRLFPLPGPSALGIGLGGGF